MIKNIQLRISIQEEKLEGILKKKAARFLNIAEKDINAVKVLRKSIDARKSEIFFNSAMSEYLTGKSNNKSCTEKSPNLCRAFFLTVTFC